jgi:hypothetical protein
MNIIDGRHIFTNAITINSKGRTSGTISDFRVQLNPAPQDVIGWSVHSIQIPTSYYVITTANYEIKWEDAVPVEFKAQIPVGNYSGSTLATALQTAMNGVVAGFTVTYNTSNYKLTWAHAANFKILTTSSIYVNIGSPPSVLGLSATSANAIEISGTRYIYIKSTKLGSGRKKHIVSDNSSTGNSATFKDYIAVLEQDVVVGNFLTKSANERDPLNLTDIQVLDYIDLSLEDDDFNIIDLNGLDWAINVEIHHSTPY